MQLELSCIQARLDSTVETMTLKFHSYLDQISMARVMLVEFSVGQILPMVYLLNMIGQVLT